MAKYIVYCLGASGKIWKSDWIDADTDREALAAAKAMDLPHGCEVWQRDRRVGQVPSQAQ